MDSDVIVCRLGPALGFAVLLVCRFAVPASEGPTFAARVRRALELLTAAPGCLGGEAGRAVDEPERWVLTVRFASVVAYRRALWPVPGARARRAAAVRGAGGRAGDVRGAGRGGAAASATEHASLRAEP